MTRLPDLGADSKPDRRLKSPAVRDLKMPETLFSLSGIVQPQAWNRDRWSPKLKADLEQCTIKVLLTIQTLFSIKNQ